jgi:GT2 family glycosyltransferase
MIEHNPKGPSKNGVFSILIPSWNNLSFLQLCISSIQKNSSFEHQIIIHVNEGSDGSLEWVKSQPELDFTYSKKNIGVCYALNGMRNLVKTDYMVFVNDDMYLCPDWDTYLMDAIKDKSDDLFFFSATVIEPEWTGNTCVIAPKNYGSAPDNFREKDLLNEFESLEKDDWSGATWPPNVVTTRLWDLVGGYSTEFSPGMYSDPDFSMKLWQAGVRDFRGIAKSRAYHFMSKTVGRIKKNNGSKQFLLKWQMTSSTFVKFYLKRGASYSGPLSEPINTSELKKKMLKNKLKRIFTA